MGALRYFIYFIQNSDQIKNNIFYFECHLALVPENLSQILEEVE